MTIPLVAWARLVEGEGSGLPTAVQECQKVLAPEPVVCFVDGFVRVTIFPRSDWGTTGAGLPALHQLPPPPADFVGREEELARLRRELTKGSVAVFAAQGLGGVGKTALALKLAEELTPSYPDGQLFFNLRGASGEPLAPTEAMAHVIRSYSPEARLPESDSELVARYRSVLHGRRTLLVMDDAAGAEQVAVLSPPSGSLLLVTSRAHFALPGLVSVSLSELSATDAREFLLRISPRIADAADQIAHLCGYLPLALRLAGSTLAERPDLSVQDYVRRLEEAPGRQTSVAASIRLSYDLLSADLQKHWRDLSVFPASFNRAAAVAVLDLNSEAADSVLGDLVRNSMLGWENDRYRLHPLLRSFAKSLREASEGEAAWYRLARHYLRVLWDTSVLYERGGDDFRRGLALFDLEWENFQAGYTWAVAHSEKTVDIARLCSAYPHAGAYCLDLRRSPRERIQWLEPALEAARRMHDRAAEAIHLGNLGNAYMNLGDFGHATPLYEKWLEVTREVGDRHGEGQALGNLGNAYYSQGDFSRAIQLFQECLLVAQEIGDRRGEGVALGNLANARKSLGDLEQAVGLYEQRLSIAREIGDRRGEGIALGNVGYTYGALGQPQRAAEFFEKQLAIAYEIGDRRSEGIALGSLGDAHAARGDLRRALEFYQQARPILREIGDRQGEAEISWAGGKVYEKEGDLAQAAAWMQVRVDYEREIGDPGAQEQAIQVQKLREAAGVDLPGPSE